MNNDDNMVILTYFIDIGHAVYNMRDDNSEGNKNSVLSISDDHGKSFFILTGYQNCRSYTRHEHSIGEKVLCNVYLIILVNHFLHQSVTKIVYRYVYRNHKFIFVY